MAVDRGLVLVLLLLSAAALAEVASGAGPFLSDGVFQVTAGSTGRSLLQARKDCPVTFEFQNYTIITSKCKGPEFPASQCCATFKDSRAHFICTSMMTAAAVHQQCSPTSTSMASTHQACSPASARKASWGFLAQMSLRKTFPLQTVGSALKEACLHG